MKITKELLEKHSSMYDDLEEVQSKLSEAYKKARLDDEQLIKYKNDEGKEIEVKQKVGWIEVKMLGFNCEAGKVLSEKYPDVLQYKNDEEKLIREIEEYEIKEFGFNYKNLSLRNTIKLINSLIEYANSKC